MNIETETDIERLRAVARLQQSWIGHLNAMLKKKSGEIDALKGEVGDFQQSLSFIERMVAAEQARAEAAAAAAADEEKAGAEKKKRKPRENFGSTPQPELELEVVRAELDEADRECPQCGLRLEPFGDHVDASELIDVTETRYRLVRVERQKYTCRCGGCLETALPPEGLQPLREGGRYSIGFSANVVLDKYAYHVPLERQARMMAALGLKTTSQTLWDQTRAAAELLKPTWLALQQHILAQPVMGLDQTGWPALNRKKAKRWQMWCLTTPDAIWHGIRDDKATATFLDLVGGFQGTVVCDALGTHGAGARASPGIQLAGCWAHVRRKFAEARDNWPEAQRALDFIRQLYDIEREATDPEHRLALRQGRSRKVLEQLDAWTRDQHPLPRSAFGKALHYVNEEWPQLNRFLDDALIPLDNNATERALRGPVVGRRNHFGSKSRRGTEAASILYSLVETAKLCGVNARDYFKEALSRAKKAPDSVYFPWDMAEQDVATE